MEQVSEYVYRLAMADYYVIGAYLLMLVSLGFVLKKLCGGVSDYFVGGNKIPWWLAGASCFMSSFSAWTFTGAAGFAYKFGILIILLFYFNVVAFLFMGRFIADKCRQTRCVTSAQVIFNRFGRLGEQFFLWVQVPNMMFGGAIWMMGLATFLSVAFGVPMSATIIISGAVILIYSTISGSWAVMTSAFLQSLVLMALSVVVAVLTLSSIGGFGGMVEQVDSSKFNLFNGEEHTWVWIVAYFSQIFMLFTSATGSTRFLAVRDGRNARKAANFAAILFLIGPIIWFIPPIAASHFFPNLGELLPGLKHPQDAAYVMMGLKLLPHGLAGLMIMVIFAATLSSMDAAINQNAGIITLNIYKPLFRPHASERELFIVSRVANVLCVVGVTAGALFLAKQEQFALFDLMLILASVIGLPLAIPFVLMYWVKKTPRWSAVASVLAGAAYSYLAVVKGWSLGIRVFGILAVGGGVFFLSRLFWKSTPDEVKAGIEKFYETMNRPVDTEAEGVGSEDVGQLKLVGMMTMVVAVGLFAVVFFPNSLNARAITAATAGSVFLIGWLMNRAGRRSIENVMKKEQ